ncbi:MAG: phosphodiester glycosidase family protein [Chloroflexales bacterium]|nr:phosphodiester glycosidase family protein [Chloroflexales bacterium]
MSLRLVRNLALLLIPVAVLYLAVQVTQSAPVVLSRWALAPPVAAKALVGAANPLVARADPVAPSHERLAAFNSASALQDRAADGQIELYRRALPGGGELAYVVARLGEQIHIELINADGATPGSDELGDTIWTDRQQHLATVAEMVSAPYAAREGMDLLAAMAFGFHGAVRTSDEGSVVINGVIHRVNAGRAALCITPGQRAIIDRFDAEALKGCRQAVGGGPVILWQGKIANPAVGAPTDDELPFNPLGEDFVQLDWRIKIYSGTYPKTAVCAGDLPGGGSFLVLATSNGVVGVDFARALRDMGCTAALGGDDDTSTQATWRGQPAWPNQPREVPDAIGVYVRS